MNIHLIAATSKNNVIGNGLDIPWKVNGEQLLFKAITSHQWIIVGRKTFETMGLLPNRKTIVITRPLPDNPSVLHSESIDSALNFLNGVAEQVFICGGGEIYKQTINKADYIHRSVIDINVDGDIFFPDMPPSFQLIYNQSFESNERYTYEIWKKT